tara:strand:+ start:607 stop:2646 length:2040 start_codon:yes stop_codon:yes gene_type:complete
MDFKAIHDQLEQYLNTFDTNTLSREDALVKIQELVSEQGAKQGDALLILQFQQFIFASQMLECVAHTGTLYDCGDWIAWGLSAEINDDKSVDLILSRVYEFITSPGISTWRNFTPILVAYLSNFYFYARQLNAMQNVGIGLWHASISVVTQIRHNPTLLDNPQNVDLVSKMLTWAVNEAPTNAQELTSLVDNWALDRVLPSSVRARLSLTLSSSGGRYSRLPTNFWACITLRDYLGYLDTEEKVQLLALTFGETKNFEELENEIHILQGNCHAAHSSLNFERIAASKAYLILPFIASCTAINRGDFILKALRAWYQTPIDNDCIDPHSFLLITPFDEKSYIAILGKELFKLDRNNQPILEKLAHTTNSFLGTALTIENTDNSFLISPERPGLPIENEDIDWSVALIDAYCPVGFPFDSEPASQLMIKSYAHPIQAIQLSSWGNTWPIAASLHKPRYDRQVNSVALWSGASTMTEEMELEIISIAFKRIGVNVEIYKGSACDADTFITVYQDSKYDILWVASHAEFDHWAPIDVKMQINEEREYVYLNDLYSQTPIHEGRRLLVLNVCDGGRFDETGITPRIGLAAGLAGPCQATISHLWPIQGYPAAVFAAHLAYRITAGDSFFNAYKGALTAMKKPPKEIARDLDEIYGEHLELAERLAYVETDFSQIQHSGSAVFYE